MLLCALAVVLETVSIISSNLFSQALSKLDEISLFSCFCEYMSILLFCNIFDKLLSLRIKNSISLPFSSKEAPSVSIYLLFLVMRFISSSRGLIFVLTNSLILVSMCVSTLPNSTTSNFRFNYSSSFQSTYFLTASSSYHFKSVPKL